MKLYIAIYIMGKLSGTIGPLPYDYDTCNNKALPILYQQQAEAWQENIANGTVAKLPLLNGKKYRGPEDTMNKCEFMDHSPFDQKK